MGASSPPSPRSLRLRSSPTQARSMSSRSPAAGVPDGLPVADRDTGDERPPEARRPGRPRSERADQAILSAALDLFAECGPDALCIEQVAAKAGVGKATIYRRWPGKEEMLMDAVSMLRTQLPEPQGRSVRADLIA